MLQGLKGGKSVVDGAADLGNTGKGVQSLSTTALNVLRGSPDLTGSNLKQTGQLSKFSNPAEMATGASRIGIDTARQTTNTRPRFKIRFSVWDQC
ncbi:hypothetical protein DFH28DRAFT_1132017 [Melampsora americana]|nr:hypothetical protein DFH28DRAFT_1132017 [Melampsora americana]